MRVPTSRNDCISATASRALGSPVAIVTMAVSANSSSVGGAPGTGGGGALAGGAVCCLAPVVSADGGCRSRAAAAAAVLSRSLNATDDDDDEVVVQADCHDSGRRMPTSSPMTLITADRLHLHRRCRGHRPVPPVVSAMTAVALSGCTVCARYRYRQGCGGGTCLRRVTTRDGTRSLRATSSKHDPVTLVIAARRLSVVASASRERLCPLVIMYGRGRGSACPQAP